MYKKLLFTLVTAILFASLAYSQITVTLPPSVVVCEGESAQLEPVINGGDGNYTYLWSPAIELSCSDCASPIVTPTITQFYNLQVQDGLGVIGNGSVLVEVSTFPFIDEDATVVSDADCHNSFTGSIDLMGDFGFSPVFNWSGPNGFTSSTEDLLSGLEAGFYSVIVDNFGGCQSSAIFEVGEPPLLDINEAGSSVTNVDCNGNLTGAIDLVVMGGVMPYTYVWTGPNGFTATTDEVTNLESGIYTVIVNDANFCEYIASFTIAEPNLLQIATASANIIDPQCFGESTGSIDIFATGGVQPYQYSWTTPFGTDIPGGNLAGLPSGVYEVTVTDANGCEAQEIFILVDPQPLEVTGVVTNGDCDEGTSGSIDLTVSGGTAPYTYLWSNAVNTEDIDGLATGTYSVTVVDSQGCTEERAYEVEGASPFVLSLGSVSCFGESDGFVEVIGSQTSWSYEWSNGSTTGPLLTDLVAGTYCVSITDENGCRSTGCIVVSEPAELEVVLVTENISCSGNFDGSIEAVVTGGTAPYAYIWNNGTTTPVITNLDIGVYEVTVVDANGCSATASAEITGSAEPLSIAIGGSPTEPCIEEFTLSAVIEGGVTPYSIQWEDTFGVIGTDIDLVNPEPGLIQLTVIDANGCLQVEIITIPFFPNIELVNDHILSCATGEATLDASGSDSGPNLQYEWTGPGGAIISNLAIVTVDQVGDYTFTISNPDVDGCSNSRTVTVAWGNDIFEEGIIVNTTGCGQYSLSGFVPPTYFGEIIFNWTYPDGSTAEDVLSIDATQTGVYELETIVPGLDCIFYSTVFLDPGADACATVRGYVYQDINELCLSDTNDPVLVGWQVIAEFAGEQLTVFTDDEGYYEFIVPAASGTVTVLPPSGNWTACEEIQSINPTPGQVVSANFWFQSEEECPQLEVSLSTPFLRRCFSSNYFIRIRNLGALPATNVDVTLEFDDFLAYLGASIVPVGVINQTVAWNIDEIQPGELVTIIVQVLVSCDAALGQVHCTEVFAAPGPDCVTSDGWSGTNLELEGVCNGSEVLFTITNTGATELAESVNFIVIEDGVAMMQQQVLDDLGGDQTESISFPANGSTYTFQLDQVENHPFSERLSVSVEGCGTDDMNSFSTGFVTQFPQATSGPNSDILCEENIGAYDPNDKSALPVGYGTPHYIEPETKIDYRIRFQNTGTDTAFTVVIRDTLSELLDLRTLELGNSSHTYSATVDLGRALTFTFNNILLPDSTTNLEASQGFVEFSIYPFDDAPLESVIENDAAIYFDFNEPIITNTVFHTLGRNFLEVVDVTTLPGVRFEWEVFPNPASNRLIVSLDGELPVELDFVIFNSLGQLEQRQRFSGNRLELDVEDLRAGWYHLQLRSVDGQVLGNAKLVKK
ncbi:MAG: T9SS type A sorting domain-containing protein [Bacteroidota bacterium]